MTWIHNYLYVNSDKNEQISNFFQVIFILNMTKQNKEIDNK